MIRHQSLTTLAAGAACLALVGAKSHKADVPLEQVPNVVVAAAERAVSGIALSEAKMRTKKSGVLFKLEGTAGTKGYQIKVDSAGKVLDVEQDAHAGRTAKAGGAAQSAGPIGETFPGSPAVRVGYIRHAPIRESSGIAASRTQRGVYWTHNDKGNAPTLYAIDRAGALLGQFHVAATHDDWEDVAATADGKLYVGNIGNNDAGRDWVEVHRVAEPRVGEAPGEAPGGASATGTAVTGLSLGVERSWRLRFPAEPFDCEALIVEGDHGFVISKRFDGSPAELYRFPLSADDDVTLERVAVIPTVAPVTSADLSADGATLAVLTYGELFVFPVAGDPAAAGWVKPRRVATPPGKLEGVCVADDGMLITSEGRDVFLVPNP